MYCCYFYVSHKRSEKTAFAFENEFWPSFWNFGCRSDKQALLERFCGAKPTHIITFQSGEVALLIFYTFARRCLHTWIAEELSGQTNLCAPVK